MHELSARGRHLTDGGIPPLRSKCLTIGPRHTTVDINNKLFAETVQAYASVLACQHGQYMPMSRCVKLHLVVVCNLWYIYRSYTYMEVCMNCP